MDGAGGTLQCSIAGGFLLVSFSFSEVGFGHVGKWLEGPRDQVRRLNSVLVFGFTRFFSLSISRNVFGEASILRYLIKSSWGSFACV